MDNKTNDRLDAVFKKWEKKSNAAQAREDAISSSGKEKWISKYGNSPAAIPRMKKNYRTPSQRQRVQHDGYSGYLPSLGIKLSHKTVTVSNKCCYRCTPNSHSVWHPKTDKQINLIHSPSCRRFGVFPYYFNDIHRSSSLRVSTHPETETAVLTSREVQAQIDTYPDKNIATAEAYKIYSKMFAHSCSLLAKVMGWIITKVFQFSTTGIFVEGKEVEILRQAVDRKLPILYLPLHRSHLDYIILMWTLCLCDLPSPFVAAGDNLNIPIIGSILRKLGAFFIRRKPKEDHELYKSILGQYMIELLKGGSSIEFFVEGRRSRSGLINPSKVGLLSQIVTAVKEGVISDVLLCPLSITYDKSPEESLTLELQGAKKEAENVFTALWYSITFPIRQHYGSVRVNFSEPFSLSEYVEKTISDVRLPTDRWINAADMDTAAVFRLATRLGDHVLFNAMETSSVSEIAVVSAVLLNRTSRSSQAELEKEGKIWKSVLDALKKNTPVSFKKGYLGEAIKDLGGCLEVTEQTVEDELIQLYKRSPNSKADLLLHYYSAPIVMFSLPVSALCISVPGIIVHNKLTDTHTVSKNSLMVRAQYICGILQSTVTVNPPCIAVDQQLSFDLDSLFTLGIFKHKQTALSTTEQTRLNKASAIWDDTGDVGNNEPEFYDDSLLVDMNKIDSCLQTGSILIPYIKTFWFVLEYTDILRESVQMNKLEFVRDLCQIGQEEYERGIRPALCTSQFHVTNFVDKLIHLRVVVIEGEYLKLSEQYDDTENFLTMVSYISLFLSERTPFYLDPE